MKKAEASYTVELALLLPAVLLALLLPVYMGYELYRETVQVSVCGYDTAFCAEEKVRAVRFARIQKVSGKKLYDLKRPCKNRRI